VDGLSYDDIAEWYDQLTRCEPWNDAVLTAVLRLLPDFCGGRVLDLATGTGHAARALAGRGARVTGIDLNESMLEIARRHEQEQPLGIEYVNGDARTLDAFADDRFDGVMASLCLGDIEDLDAVLGASRRVLRHGGWFAWSVPHPCFTPPAAVVTQTEDGRPAKLVTGYFDEGFQRADSATAVRRVGAHHRTLTTYLNAFVGSGFKLERFAEPRVEADARRPTYAELPAFIVGVATRP
jgi:ubiquinone/menaquinone biosynthesis C-methylase UbiE